MIQIPVGSEQIFQYFLFEFVMVAIVLGIACGIVFVIIDFAYRRAKHTFGSHWDRAVIALENMDKSLIKITSDKEKAT